MKRRSIYILIILGLALAAGMVLVYAAPSDWIMDLTKYPTVADQINALAGVAPGLGTVMVEYSTRYTNMYYAAKGGNWDLAAYQLKEALEIQEVGETTRPARASALIGFETTYLNPIGDAITAKDFNAFKSAFNAGISGCNGCHVGQGFPFIKYVLPKAPLSPLSTKPPAQ
jgi:hypothetical protein